VIYVDSSVALAHPRTRGQAVALASYDQRMLAAAQTLAIEPAALYRRRLSLRSIAVSAVGLRLSHDHP
jgi:hypothetical protein